MFCDAGFCEKPGEVKNIIDKIHKSECFNKSTKEEYSLCVAVT
jgi:hypothetical protein